MNGLKVFITKIGINNNIIFQRFHRFIIENIRSLSLKLFQVWKILYLVEMRKKIIELKIDIQKEIKTNHNKSIRLVFPSLFILIEIENVTDGVQKLFIFSFGREKIHKEVFKALKMSLPHLLKQEER